jgi:HAE1 family hydrophobic/amphiphilic exporter-1
MPKDASLEQTNFMTQKKKEAFLKEYVHSQITTVGQTSEGFGASNCLQSEIDVND